MPNRRIPAPDGDVGNWGNVLNDYLRQISDVGAGNVATNSSAFTGGLNNWTNATRPTQVWSYTKTGGAGNETLGIDHAGLTGINTTTGQLEKWTGTAWAVLTYPNLVSTSGNIGIGTVSPTAKLNVFAENTGTENIVDFSHYGDSINAPVLRFRKARGTLAVPTAIQTGDQLGSVNFTGHNGTALTGVRSAITGIARENFTSTANGAGLYFTSTPNGSITPIERMRIDQNGNIGLATTSPNSLLDLGQNGASATSSTTQSSSGILSLTGSYWTGSAETKNRFTFQNIASSTVANSGLLGVLWNSTEIMTLANDGIVRIAGTNVSTSATTGTLVVAGGVGIAGGLNLGTSLALRTNGGANGRISFADAGGSFPFLVCQSDNNFIFYGTNSTGVTRPIWSNTQRSDTSSFIFGATVPVNIQNTAVSTSSTTGALTVGGGVGIAGNLILGGGQLNLTNGTSNLLTFLTVAVGAPTFTTRSVGTKLLLWNNLAATTSDYAIGMENSNMWFSVPANLSNLGFKWYGGTTNIATLDGTGNLTISAKVTAANLQITTGATAGRVLTSDASGNATWQVASGGSAIPAGANTQIQFNNSGAFGANANLVWDNTNNRLGIGIATPVANFQVGTRSSAATVNNSTIGVFGGTGTGILTNLTLHNNAVAAIGNGASLSFTPAPGYSATASVNAAIENISTASTYLSFNTYDSSLNEKMRITGAGNVGIGTTTPTSKLHVVGSILASGSSYNGNIQIENTGKTGASLSTRYVLFNMASGDAGGTGQNGFHVYSYNNATFKSIPLTILDNDNVGIGTTAPGSRLHVVGTTLCLTATGATSIPLTATNSGQAGLEIRAITTTGAPGTIGTAHISFHRPGLFAANFGLDTDNQFAIGGWSSGAGYTGLKTGNLTVNGTITSTGLIATINSISPTNGAIRLTPNLHLNASTGFGVYLNWDNGAATGTNNSFVIGNGVGSSVMTVLYNGNTSITGNITSLGGLVPPSGVISSIFSNSLHLSSNNGNPVYLNYGNAGTNYGSIPAFIIGNGQGGSNTSISYSGVITCISVTQSSDLRLKTNITQLRDSLSKVTQIKGISFNWKEENRGLETQIGVIAQEVEAFWPELVTNNYNGFKSVNYSGLIAPIIEAVKEQQAQINNLGVVNIENFKSETKTQNQELTTKIETLTGEVGVLKSENIATKTETANFGIELTKSKTELGELKSQFETGKTEITNLKNELTTLKTEKSEIVAKNQTQQTQIDNLEAKNLETKTDLAKVTRENQTLKTSLETLENVNKTTKTDLENLKTEIEKIKLFVNFAS